MEADRANAEIERYTRHGQYLGTLRLPAGSMPCDIDYLGRYAVVPALDVRQQRIGPSICPGVPWTGTRTARSRRCSTRTTSCWCP